MTNEKLQLYIIKALPSKKSKVRQGLTLISYLNICQQRVKRKKDALSFLFLQTQRTYRDTAERKMKTLRMLTLSKNSSSSYNTGLTSRLPS